MLFMFFHVFRSCCFNFGSFQAVFNVSAFVDHLCILFNKCSCGQSFNQFKHGFHHV